MQDTLHSIEVMLPALGKGLLVTLELTFFSAIGAFLLSFLAGFGRRAKFRPLRVVTGIYVEVFRGTSLMVQLFWFYFCLPFFGIKLPALTVGILVIALNYGAYGSEVVRGGIAAVPQGQLEAAAALNMPSALTMRRILLPQAFVQMLPGFANLLVELLKGTSLVSLITLADLTYQANLLRSTTLQTGLVYTLVLLIYFIIAYPMMRALRGAERRMAVGRG